MPVYVHCPYCDHPQIVTAKRRGKALFCKQCGWVYQTSRHSSTVQPLAICSISELRDRRSGGGKVYVIDA